MHFIRRRRHSSLVFQGFPLDQTCFSGFDKVGKGADIFIWTET